MASFGVARLRDIRQMLADGAPGHDFAAKPHNFRVTWNGRTFPSLPKGGHSEENPEIQLGKVKQMINHLRIDMDCARRHLPLK